MNWHGEQIQIQTRGKGLYPCTDAVQQVVHKSGIQEGLCFLFLQHTSASLLLSESYDPSARMDMETFMEKMVPERQPWYRHTLEGADDSPSHIRAMLTSVSETIPIERGQLALGTWQGIYLFEHRQAAQTRRLLIRCLRLDV